MVLVEAAGVLWRVFPLTLETLMKPLRCSHTERVTHVRGVENLHFKHAQRTNTQSSNNVTFDAPTRDSQSALSLTRCQWQREGGRTEAFPQLFTCPDSR